VALQAAMWQALARFWKVILETEYKATEDVMIEKGSCHGKTRF
jgi:hypothetical protein